MQFMPNNNEELMISKIIKKSGTEFVLIRLTDTMLKKSIVDASRAFRQLLSENSIVDYESLIPGRDKLVIRASMLTLREDEVKVSLYRPKTKKGDPRFCVYGMRSLLRSGDMIFITVYKGNLVIIPLVNRFFSEEILTHYFKVEANPIKDELIELLRTLKSKGPVKSVSPEKRNPKDVGDTLEREIGLLPNSNIIADYKGAIELKAKRKGFNTKDTLFSMVPDWKLSSINSSNEMILTYGYPSNKYQGYQDLFVAVNNKANNQGLYLVVDEEEGYLHQMHQDKSGKITDTCIWNLEELKKRFYSKHPETMWVVAEETIMDNEIYFVFDSIEYTRAPVFSSFLLLISKGIVTYDWRGRVRLNGSGYKDKGHCFRVLPKNRNLLFGEIEIINI